nr:MAG TPA: hypothetical protein [Caudoviricetes sp.]
MDMGYPPVWCLGTWPGVFLYADAGRGFTRSPGSLRWVDRRTA